MNTKLDKDLKEFLNIYNKFEYDERIEMQSCIIKGEINICDTDGNYWNSFDIEIYINKETYPYCIPLVIEVSKIIDRDQDWHISDKGVCCLEIEHELEYMANRGINIILFYQKMIYPYFANALYKKEEGNYANGEYLHDFGAIIQFYREKFKLKDISVIIKILTSVVNNDIPGRNQLCLCGKDEKIKKCHLPAINFLKSLSMERIKKDLEGFKNHFQKLK